MKILSRCLLIFFATIAFHAFGLSNQEITQESVTEAHIEGIQHQASDSKSHLLEESVPVTEMEAPSDVSLDSDVIGIFDVAGGCCKICRKGKACGDSCIAANKSCHKGKGCACNATY